MGKSLEPRVIAEGIEPKNNSHTCKPSTARKDKATSSDSEIGGNDLTVGDDYEDTIVDTFLSRILVSHC